MLFITKPALQTLVISCAICLTCTSCKKDANNPAEPIVEAPPIEDLEIPDEFSYGTFKPVSFNIGVQTLDGNPLAGAHVQIFTEAPSNIRPNTPFIAGVTSDNGVFAVETVLPADLSQIYLWSSLIGGLNNIELSTGGGQVQHTFRVVRGGDRVSGNGSDKPTIDLVHFDDPIITADNMSIIIQEISGIEVVDGAEIACITPDSLVAGAAYVIFDETGQMGMAVWADDATSPDTIDGFSPGEPLNFVYWDPESQSELPATITQHLGGDLFFSSNGILIIRLHVDAPGSRIRYFGGWTENGIPDILDHTDEDFTSTFLQNLSIALPENADITSTYDRFIVESGDIQLSAEAEVWLSFLHEGTSERHAMGFYTYPTGDAPRNADEVEALIIVFPNLSFADGDSGLALGNRVNLGEFAAGTSIGWFIFVDGWNGGGVDEEVEILYSNSDFNPGAGQLKRQSILFYDDASDRLVLGFEEHSRAGSTDDDFNDVLFSVTAEPADAIIIRDLPVWNQDDPPPDVDGDGISDAIDAFPNDETLAFANHFPAPDRSGTIAFENNFPETGDYDFNDLVITYAFNLQTNPNGRVVKIIVEFDIKAIGTASRDGFGFILPLNAGQVRQVTGSVLNAGYLNMTGSNLEAGQNAAVVIVIDDALSRARPAGGFDFVNTEDGSPEVGSQAINLVIELSDPVDFSQLGAPPYNPFLIVDANRGYEIHAADMPGSDLMDNELFGQGRDNSDPNAGRYYKSDVNLPWALVLSGEWRHPIEGTPINAAYRNFAVWSESGGGIGLGWFLPVGGNIAEGMTWTGE